MASAERSWPSDRRSLLTLLKVGSYWLLEHPATPRSDQSQYMIREDLRSFGTKRRISPSVLSRLTGEFDWFHCRID